MRRPAQRRQGLCKLMKTCALVLAKRLTFVGGGCHPFQPLTGFDGRGQTRLKAVVRNASPQKRRILPPLNDPADPENHVFFSLTNYDKKIDKLFEGGGKVVFIRGGVAIGKTTLAKHLAREFPQKYVNVPFTGAGMLHAWLTLVYDEAHTLFTSPALCSALFKSHTAYRPKILLFSASGDASIASTLIVPTPGEITQKYMWTPPLNFTSELREQLEEAGC